MRTKNTSPRKSPSAWYVDCSLPDEAAHAVKVDTLTDALLHDECGSLAARLSTKTRHHFVKYSDQ
jgi:hypothetical protein